MIWSLDGLTINVESIFQFVRYVAEDLHLDALIIFQIWSKPLCRIQNILALQLIDPLRTTKRLGKLENLTCSHYSLQSLISACNSGAFRL